MLKINAKNTNKERTIPNTIMSYQVIHKRPDCIGCGACASLCPEYWHMDADGKSKLKNAIKQKNGIETAEFKEGLKCNQKAANACPVQIISIKE